MISDIDFKVFSFTRRVGEFFPAVVRASHDVAVCRDTLTKAEEHAQTRRVKEKTLKSKSEIKEPTRYEDRMNFIRFGRQKN